MEDIVEQFKDWLEERHLRECPSCQKEGKARLQDSSAQAYWLFKEFHEQKV